MSVRVELSELAEAVAARRFGYLVSVRDDGRVHVVALVPDVEVASEPAHGVSSDLAGPVRMRFAAGGTARHNAEYRPEVTVVFPPTDADPYSLVVDGRASVDGDVVVVEATSAVLHRPAP